MSRADEIFDNVMKAMQDAEEIWGVEGNFIDFDIEKELAEHLAEGQVAVLVEVGAEGTQVLTGRAIAVAWDGRKTDVYIDEIYNRAEKLFGVRPSSAAW